MVGLLQMFFQPCFPHPFDHEEWLRALLIDVPSELFDLEKAPGVFVKTYQPVLLFGVAAEFDLRCVRKSICQRERKDTRLIFFGLFLEASGASQLGKLNRLLL